MDRKTEATLERINQGIPRHLRENTTRLEVDRSEEELAEKVLAERNIDPEKKKHVKQLLDAGKFRRSEEVVDEKTVREIDKYHEREIAKARRQGALKSPMEDKFYRERMQRLMKGGIPKSQYISKEELQRSARELQRGFKK